VSQACWLKSKPHWTSKPAMAAPRDMPPPPQKQSPKVYLRLIVEARRPEGGGVGREVVPNC